MITSVSGEVAITVSAGNPLILGKLFVTDRPYQWMSVIYQMGMYLTVVKNES